MPFFYRSICLFLVMGISFTSLYASDNKVTARSLKKNLSSLSYGVGYDLVEQTRSLLGSHPIDEDQLLQGVKDALKGKDRIISREEIVQSFQFINEINKESKMQNAQKNKEEAESFLEKNKARDEVITLDSGLQYEVLQEGEGVKAKKTDYVITHYHGTLIDGTVFDSSVKRGQPAEFPVSGVISGWVEALQLMSVGSKWKLYVPPQLAYGERGAGNVIGPNQLLIFEIELLEIK